MKSKLGPLVKKMLKDQTNGPLIVGLYPSRRAYVAIMSTSRSRTKAEGRSAEAALDALEARLKEESR